MHFHCNGYLCIIVQNTYTNNFHCTCIHTNTFNGDLFQIPKYVLKICWDLFWSYTDMTVICFNLFQLPLRPMINNTQGLVTNLHSLRIPSLVFNMIGKSYVPWISQPYLFLCSFKYVGFLICWRASMMYQIRNSI